MGNGFELVWSPDVTIFIDDIQKKPRLLFSRFLIYPSSDEESRSSEKTEIDIAEGSSQSYPRQANSSSSVHRKIDGTSERDVSKRSHSSCVGWTIWRWQREIITSLMSYVSSFPLERESTQDDMYTIISLRWLSHPRTQMRRTPERLFE